MVGEMLLGINHPPNHHLWAVQVVQAIPNDGVIIGFTTLQLMRMMRTMRITKLMVKQNILVSILSEIGIYS